MLGQGIQQGQRRPHERLQVTRFAVLGRRHDDHQQIHLIRRQHGRALSEILAIQLHPCRTLLPAADGTDPMPFGQQHLRQPRAQIPETRNQDMRHIAPN